MSRPYFSFSGKQLTELLEQAKGDTKALKALRDELSYRTTGKMVALRVKVDDAIRASATNPASQLQSSQIRQTDIFENSGSREELSDGNSTETPSPKPNVPDSIKLKPKKPVDNPYSSDDEDLLNPGINENDELDIPIFGKLGSVRSCGNLRDIPSRWNPPEKQGIALEIPEGASQIVRYTVALRALVKEMKRKGSGMRTVALENGQSVILDGRDRGYCFAFDGEAELFEGAKIVVVVNQRNIDGRLVSVSNRTITVSVEEDLGEKVLACQLKIDNTAMIETLIERLESAEKGELKFNQKMAEDVISNTGDEQPLNNSPHCQDLNEKQAQAVSCILSNPVTYLWGPPGTGKTKSLTVAIQLLFEQGKRILICSNTNQAVDQVLLKLCETLTKDHTSMEEGRVLRLGQIHHVELRNDWSEWITLDGVVGRRSKDLKEGKEALEINVERLQTEAEKTKRILETFKLLDAASIELSECLNHQQALEKGLANSKKKVEERTSDLSKLNKELSEQASAGFMKRLVLRSSEDINKDIWKATSSIKKEHEKIREQERTLAFGELSKKIKDLITTRESLNQHLVGVNREAIQREVEELDEKIHTLNREISDINRKLDEIEKTIVNEAKILGATVSKAFLSAQLFDDFDVVVLDEASMVLLPAAFYVSGLAKDKVVISGDFRQLSPIVSSDQKEILNEIGSDVFSSAGIEKAFNEKSSLKRTVMLEQQYRMHSDICDLISPRMYDSRLTTALNGRSDVSSMPVPFDGRLIIVDTSPIQPFVNRHGSSRYNLMHALLIRNICRFLRDSGFVCDQKSLGICTPFSAQKEVIKRVLKPWNIDEMVESGTVHRYQGDEKDAMIVDVPDSLGEHYVGMFAQAEHPDEVGAKLFNVAISRAKEHVIFVANLDYLDKKLPAQAFLREILSLVQKRGKVVNSQDVLAMWPIQDELRSFGQPFELGAETLASGLFKQNDFELVCGADISEAKRSVAIFSGFVTPQRVASYETLFRSKLGDGIKIRCVTRPPKRNGSIPEDMGRDALNGLEAMGCIVDTRWNIHEKVVIIDDEIFWVGSLNPLSHTNRTDEMMVRYQGREASLQLAAFMSIRSDVNPDKADGLSVAKENPHCPDCRSRTVYRTGSYGPFWQCEDECGWKESLKNFNNKGANQSLTPVKNGPKCPICSSKTELRRGPYGSFYGCTKYPSCNGIIKINDKKVSKTTEKKRVTSPSARAKKAN